VSWDEIAKQLQSRQNFGRYIKANSDELKYLKKATKDLNNQSKMEFIYDYISSKYKWNDKYSIGGDK
jgi:ribosomal protein L20A (L18A)